MIRFHNCQVSYPSCKVLLFVVFYFSSFPVRQLYISADALDSWSGMSPFGDLGIGLVFDLVFSRLLAVTLYQTFLVFVNWL